MKALLAVVSFVALLAATFAQPATSCPSTVFNDWKNNATFHFQTEGCPPPETYAQIAFMTEILPSDPWQDTCINAVYSAMVAEDFPNTIWYNSGCGNWEYGHGCDIWYTCI